MSELSERSTVYFDPDLHRALRIKAAATHRSVSEIVNEALRLALREVRRTSPHSRSGPLSRF